MPAPRLAAVVLGLVFVPAACWAADVTPAGATALEGELRDWIASLTGPNVTLPSRPIQVTQEGDHYHMAVPFKVGHDELQVTANARPLDDGKWTVNDLRLPSPLTFVVDMPKTTTDDGKPNPMSGPVTYNITYANQSGQMLFDPTYETASTFNSSAQGFDMTATAEHGKITSHIDRTTTSSILQPANDGRLDLLSEGSAEGYSIQAQGGDTPFKVGIGQLRVTSQMNGFSQERGMQILRAFAQIGESMQAAAKAGGPKPKPDPQVLEALLDALADVATGLSVDESFGQLAVDYGPTGGLLNSARMGFAAKNDNGVLQARMDLGMEGLTLHDVPLSGMEALIPTRIAFRPAVSGVAVSDLMKLLKDAQDGSSPPDDDVQALFSHGGISAGLESFAIDVAGASFTGMGKLVFAGPSAFQGTAQITATNLDLLQQQVAANPMLAQGLPVFIFAKGIGRSSGNQTVWDVRYQDGKLIINDQDMTSMLGGGGGGGGATDGGVKAQPAPRPGQPARRK